MSWWPDFTNVKASVFTEAIKKKACGFLLRRYGGNWLKEKAINLDQLTLDLYNGRAKFTNFELDVANINELLDCYSLPLEVVDCFVGSLDIFVPWGSIFADNSRLEIQNLEITLRHRARNVKESSLFDSMLYSSMTTSMKLAEECLKNENSEDKKSSASMPYYEGLHDLACTVEAIFVKVKGTLIDTTICFEHINDNYTTVFELKIARVEYFDDEVERTGVVADEDGTPGRVSEEKEGKKVCDLASVRSKNLVFQGVRLYMGIERELNKSASGRTPKPNGVDSILIGDFVGRHKLRVSFSHEQEANSVKMLIESQIEGINMVMCPRVLSYIHHICSDISASIAKPEPAEKSITSDDYEKIRKGIEAPSIPTGIGGGGRQNFAPSNRDDFFQSMAPSGFSNSGFQSMESSVSSMMSSCSTINGVPKQRGKGSNRHDKKAEEDRISSTEVSLRVSFVSFILLHEDAAQEGESWHDNLRSLEDKYLGVIKDVPLSGIANSSDLIKLRKHFSAILNRDHFSLMLKHLDMVALLDNKDNCLRNKFFDMELTVGLADFAEAIVRTGGKGINFCPWLMFEEGFLVVRDQEPTSIGRPSFKLKIEPLEREEKSLMSRSSSSPFLVTLATTRCSSELDVTVLNRIHSILAAFSPVASNKHLQRAKEPTQSFLFNNEVEDDYREKIAFALSSSCWVCKIRFPKADLTETSRRRKGGRHLHDDSLLFDIQKLNLKTELILVGNEFQDFELYFMSAKGHLMTSTESHCLLHISSNLFVKGQDDGFDWPRIKVRLSSGSSSILGSGMNFSVKELDPMSASFYPMMAQGSRAPFSSKRRQFKNRELIEPGERSEMTSFLDNEGNNSSITIDANLQQVLLFLPNKNALELLYNRLLGDVLLWTPAIPANLSFEGPSAAPPFVEQNLFTSETRSPSDENVHDQDDFDESKTDVPEKQSRICVSIFIQEGRIVADVQDSPQPRRFVLSLTDLALPLVSCYHGDPLLHYLCMQASSLDLSHSAISDSQRGSTGYDIHARMDGKNWKKILQVNKDHLGLERFCSSRDVMSMTLMIKEENNQLVHYKLAVKLRNCSLVHVDMPREEQHWVFQLMELFSLVDYDIPGYQLPQSISELHLSLENCAVEYRPVLLPHHVLLFCESVHVTSNAIPEAVGYKLNIWIEDTGLFMSSRQTHKKIDLKRDFVCVADINSFDLSLKQLKDFYEERKRPQTSLTASINRLHVRTCSDSFVALSQVIIHLANMGEFLQQPSVSSNSIEEAQDVPVVTTEVKQTEVSKLLEDAINSEFTSRTDSPDHQLHPGRGLVSKFDEKPVAYVFNSPLVSSQESLSSSFSDGSDNVKSIEDPNSGRNQRLHQDGGVAEKLNFIDNHFAKPTGRSSTFESDDYPVPLEKYQLTDTSVTWHIFGGNDFSPELLERRSGQKQKVRKWQDICGQGRNPSVLVELQLNKVQLLHEVYPDGLRDLSRDVLFIREVEVLDKLEVSDINKFLHLYVSETLPKPINGNMIKVSAHYARPEESKDKKECQLKISLQPVKLNIDQDTLTFLTNFFTDVNNMAHKTFLPPSPKMASERPQDLEEDGYGTVELSPKKEAGATYAPIFFSVVRFSPDVVIKIDYKGKRVEQGTLVGLLVGLTQLNQSQIVLKKISYKRGLLGVDKVAEYMFNEWVKDIRANQLSGLLRGVGPMNSFFQFVQGVRDLFWMPVEQYRKDGRIMRGIQRGTYSFASCTAISALELTNKLFNTILFIAEAAHDIVSPSNHDRKRGTQKRPRQLKQPEDLREGVTRACEVVKEGLHNRATELIDVVAKEHEQKGVAGAIGGVLRQIPPTVIEPIIVASKATSNVLGGVRNQLMPDMRKEDLEKWKTN